MIKIVSRRLIRTEDIGRFQALAGELVRLSQKEPGCLSYTLNQSRDDRG